MGASASDVRAGAAYYEMYGKDALTPVLAKCRATVAAFGQFLQGFNPGAGGAGFLNRLVFGAKDVDAKTGQYLGRVGGLVAPLRGLFAPLAGGLGVVDEYLFGKKKFHAGEYVGRVGGLLAPLRAMLDSGSRGTGLVNSWLFGDKRFDNKTGLFVGRIGGLVDVARRAGGAMAGMFTGAVGAAQQFSGRLIKVGGILGGLGAGLGAPLLAFFKAGTDEAADMARQAKATGLTVDMLSRFHRVAKDSGVSVEEVQQDTTGRYSEDLKNATPIRADDAKAAAAAQKDFADATRAVQDALTPLIQIVAPVVKEIAEWVKRNAALVAVLVPVAAGLVGLGVAAGVVSFAVTGLIAVFGVLKAIVLGTLAAILSPFGLVAAAVAGLTYAFFTMTDTGRDAASAIRGDLTRAFDTAKSAAGGIAAALQKGDLAGAAEIATTAIELLWAGLMLRMEKAWADFKGVFVEGWHDAVGGLAEPLEEVWNALKGGFKDAWGVVKSGLDDAWNWIKGIVEKIKTVWNNLWDRFGEPVMRVVNFLKPVAIAMAAPFLIAVGAIMTVWDSLDSNIRITVNNLGAAVEKIFARVGAAVQNALVDVFTFVFKQFEDGLRKLAKFDPSGLLDKGVEAVASAREAVEKIGKRDGEAESAKIEGDRANREKELRAELATAKKAREEARAGDVKAADDKTAALEEQLKKLNADAGKPREPDKDPLGVIKPGLVPDVSVKGTFGGANAAAQLGFSDKTVQQTELLKQLISVTEKAPEATGAAVGKVITTALQVR